MYLMSQSLFIADATYAEPVKKLQDEMYHQLLILRETLAQTIEEAIKQSASAPANAYAEQKEGVANASEEEMKKLKDENQRLNYRIKHLIKTLNEVEKK